MIVRIKKKLYFKPRLCPDCGRTCLFCRCHLSQRCKRCHKKHDNWKHHKKSHIKRRAIQKLKYNPKYKRMRKRLIKTHPYCALCGSKIRLTVHHVGGGCEHYTVLCDECHQAYERYNTKRKVKQCIQNNGISRNIKSIRGAMRGCMLAVGLRLLSLRSYAREYKSWNLR